MLKSELGWSVGDGNRSDHIKSHSRVCSSGAGSDLPSVFVGQAIQPPVEAALSIPLRSNPLPDGRGSVGLPLPSGCFFGATGGVVGGVAGAVGLFKGIDVGFVVGPPGFNLSYRSMMSLVTSIAVDIQ